MDESRQQTIRNELKRFQSSIWDEYEREVPQELLHYTKPTGFRGIVESKELWVRDVCRMNDSSEGLYAHELLQEVIRQKSVPPGFRQFIWDLKTLLAMGSRWRGYIACFSRGGEQPSQWNDYAEGCKGCAIGFKGTEMFGAARGGERYELVTMLYEPNRQREQLSRTIDHAIHLWRGSGLAKRDQGEFWQEVIFVLLGCSLRLKKPCFASEEEVRLWITEADRNDDPGANRETDNPRHVGIQLEPALLKRVIVGPKAGPDLTPDEVRSLLDGHGFNTVRVERSIVAVR